MVDWELREVVDSEAAAELVLCVQPGSEQSVPVFVLEQLGKALWRVPVVTHGRLHPAHHEGHVVGGEGGEQQVCQLRGAHHGEPDMRSIFNLTWFKLIKYLHLTSSRAWIVSLSM